MRSKALSFVTILLIAGSIDARPSKADGSPESVVTEKDEKSIGKGPDESSGGGIEPRRSSVPKTDSRVELKDLRYMDQSLRTVATQLLNVTNPNDEESSQDEKLSIVPKIAGNVLIIQNNREKANPARLSSTEKSDDKSVEDTNSGITLGAMNFGRPTNSKFGYLEASHPGEAMALTEEELERELMATSTRVSENPKNSQKNRLTTTGGISTWILLNPPSTTIKSTETKDEKVTESKTTSPVKVLETTAKNEVATSLEKISSQITSPMEKIITLTKSTTASVKKTTTSSATTTPKSTPSPKIEKTKVSSTVAETSFQPSSVTTESSTTTTTTTKRLPETTRPTARLKITTPKATNVTSRPMATKFSRPANSSIKAKITPTRIKVTTKIPLETTKNPSTSRIEKVTFSRPVHMITTTPKSVERDESNVENPIFLTKVKTSLTASSAGSNATSSSSSSATTSAKNETRSSSGVTAESSVASKTKAKPTKASNVLKVQLKRPTESSTSIEIEPIRVNAPILKVEKIESSEKAISTKNSTKPAPIIPQNSKIDVKFDFIPEATKIQTETMSSTRATTTTRRPPPAHNKRKKNKLRRRRPTTTTSSSVAPSTTTTTTVAVPAGPESLESLSELGLVDNTIQESKIAPESSSGTKNKKKQVQKPIGTQIYNFLSREVMPSFGMMSLVGLGLGLASYFLYPFSGAIARRNYVVEPNYKYNMDEYGGNYGQREEEVFSKVLQGMTNQEGGGKYGEGGIKDYENNYYNRYQQHQAYQHQHHSPPLPDDIKYTTRRIPEPTSRLSTVSSLVYRHQPETTIYQKNKRNDDAEFKFPEPTSPSYYDERTKKPDFVGKKSNDHRQFVVGNIPKEYGFEENNPSTTGESLVNLHSESYKYPVVESPSNYGHAAEAALKSISGDYEDIEITPSAVQVEHGPRFLIGSRALRRRKRESSVIQLIPSRTEIEKEVKEIENEEPLSNEILDIFDSVIPDKMPHPGSKFDHALDKKKSPGDESRLNQMFPDKNKYSVVAMSDVEQTTASYQQKVRSESQESTENIETTTNLSEWKNSGDSSSSTVSTLLTIEDILETTTESEDINPDGLSNVEENVEPTTAKPQQERFNVFSFVKKIAEVKLRLGVAILKHASEGFARYLGHVQKRINGEE